MTEYDSENKLRGLEKFTRPKAELDVGGVATVGALRGLEKFTKPEGGEDSVAPADYDISDDIKEQIEKRVGNPELIAIEDPDGILKPGLLLTSSRDPEHRRLVTNLYRSVRTGDMVVVHIEGEAGLRNLRPEELKRKIAEGELMLPAKLES